jgi:hypothetical protein
MSRRVALVVLAFAAVALFATGAFGFTSVSAERGVSVAVVDDESAFLGLPNDPAVDCTVGGSPEEDCKELELLTVTNQFSTGLTALSVAPAESEASVEDLAVSADVDDATPLQPGDAVTITGDVDCAAGETVTAELTITVAGDGVEATKYDKEVRVDCERSDEVRFAGCGQVFVPDGYVVNAYVYEVSPGNTDELVYEKRMTRGGPGKLVGVETTEGAYLNGNFDFGAGDCGDQQGDRSAGVPVESRAPWDASENGGAAAERDGKNGTNDDTAAPGNDETED